MSWQVRSNVAKRVTYAVRLSSSPADQAAGSAATSVSCVSCVQCPAACSILRFTVLHSIAYEINRICQCLVLTGSNTIDKDYIYLSHSHSPTPSHCFTLRVCVRSCSAYWAKQRHWLPNWAYEWYGQQLKALDNCGVGNEHAPHTHIHTHTHDTH